MKKFFAAAAATVALSAMGAAQAAVVDFTDRSNLLDSSSAGNALGVDIFRGVPNPNTQNPFYMKVGPGSLVAKITGNPAVTNAAEKPNANCAVVTGLTCDSDGLGINNDEITTNGVRQQSVTVEFLDINGPSASNPTGLIAVRIDRLDFLDLFFDKDAVGTPVPGAGGNQESVVFEAFDIAGASLGVFENAFGTTANTPGALGFEQTFPFLTGVTKIVFTAGLGEDDGNGDFALAAIELTAPPGIITPIPGAVPLFLAGLGGLAVARRRRNA